MDDAAGVDRLQPAQRLDPELDGQRDRKGAEAAQAVARILALDVLPDHIEAAVGQPREVVEDGDVGVLDLGGEAGLAHEPLLGRRVGGQVLAQDLDHPQLLEVEVADQVDLSHPAAPQALHDLVFAVEDGPGLPRVQATPPNGRAYCTWDLTPCPLSGRPRVLFSINMKRMRHQGLGRQLEADRRVSGLTKGLLVAGAVVGVPLLVSEVIRRRAEPPQSPRWGRTHRFAGVLGEIVFQELGAGSPPLVLLHSFGPGYDGDQWRRASELLAERHTVYVPDLPGWGRSEAPRGGYVPESYVDAIDGFLRRVVRDRAVVVAAGMAAAYAVRIAAAHPERVGALVLATPLGIEADAAVFDNARTTFFRQLLHLPILRTTALDWLTSRPALAQHLRKEVYAAPERVDAALLDHHYRASHQPRARAALAAWLGGDLWMAVEDDLERLEVPLLLTWGRAAKSAPPENADLWLRGAPHAHIEVFEGSGELPHVESPTAFSRAVERFLGGG